MKILFLSWSSYHRRSELLAQHFGAKIFYVSYGKRGKLLDILLKYPIQSLQTWSILKKENPLVIFVQNPPIFCALVAYLYGKLFGSEYIIDSHTGAFLDLKWRGFLGLHRWLSRRALTTIVHNNSQEEFMKAWKCPYCVIGYTPGNYPEGEPFPFQRQFNIAVISTYGDDEPLELIFEAARCVPDVDFYITGDDRQITPSLRKNKPENCYLTGYLSYSLYIGLLRHADSIMDLTTRDHTLLMGGFEAVSLGTPLITSDWPVLKEYFSLGTVHTSNTVEGLCESVHYVKSNHASLKQGMLRAQEMLQNEWEQKYNELYSVIHHYEVNKSKNDPYT